MPTLQKQQPASPPNQKEIYEKARKKRPQRFDEQDDAVLVIDPLSLDTPLSAELAANLRNYADARERRLRTRTGASFWDNPHPNTVNTDFFAAHGPIASPTSASDVSSNSDQDALATTESDSSLTTDMLAVSPQVNVSDSDSIHTSDLDSSEEEEALQTAYSSFGFGGRQ